MNSPRSTQRAQRNTNRLQIAKCNFQIANCRTKCIGNVKSKRFDFKRYLCKLCVLCGYIVAFTSRADAAPQDVVPVEGPLVQGELVSIAEGRASFRVSGQQPTAGEVRALALDQLVRWGNPVAPKAQAIVVLTDGGQIVAATDWAGGDVVKFSGDEVVVQSGPLQEVRLRRAAVSGVVFALQRTVDDREKLVATM